MTLVRFDMGTRGAERELWINPSEVCFIRGYSGESGLMTEIGTKQGVVFSVSNNAGEVAARLFQFKCSEPV